MGRTEKLEVPREDGTFSASGNPFHSCSSHSRYTRSILNAEQGLQEIEKHEADEETWKRLFLTQASSARISRIVHSNKVPKGRVIQALVDCNSATNR